MNLSFNFLNDKTKAFFNDSSRAQCIAGGFGSGKSYVCCQKILFLCVMFDNYKCVVARHTFKDLVRTTVPTFLKVCPPELLEIVNERDGLIKFRNGSQVLLMHLDTASEQSLRGLEVNSVYIDQPEEVSEAVFTTLNARIGRWDKAVPSKLASGLGFKKDGLGNWKVPSYFLLSPNPDTETHWIWRYFHPNSFERRPGYSYHQVSALENPHYNPETLSDMMKRDKSWVDRFVHGNWGISEAQIHSIHPASRLVDVSAEFVETLRRKWRLYRAMDHGESAPTCCLWVANQGSIHIVYQEYYQPSKPISYHRERIAELSGDDVYQINLADPSIFKKGTLKSGSFWSVADEWLDERVSGKPIPWQPADNNELATRNRINELLALSKGAMNPLTGELEAPCVYFVMRSADNPHGVQVLDKQIAAQRRVKLDEINGKPIYSDEREESSATEDHAYDAFRYYVAHHAFGLVKQTRTHKANSFRAAQDRVKALRISRSMGAIA